jgi:hypothetical protein
MGVSGLASLRWSSTVSSCRSEASSHLFSTSRSVYRACIRAVGELSAVGTKFTVERTLLRLRVVGHTHMQTKTSRTCVNNTDYTIKSYWELWSTLCT